MALMALYVVVGILSLVVQGLLPHLGLPQHVVPQLVVLLVVFLAFYEVSVAGSFLAFSLGLLLDLSSAQALGPWAGACVMVFGVCSLLSQRLFIDSGAVATVVSALAVVVVEAFYLLVAINAPELSWQLIGTILSHALVSALCAPLLFSFLSRRAKKLSPHAIGRASVVSSV